jgi:sulfoxide reductase heme-binding subunit YedZ
MTLWFLTRASALVAFGLLTVSFLLGLLSTGRGTPGLPRFASQALHRNATLLAIAFTVVHIASSALDSYVSVGWLAAVVPFTSGYRDFWVTLGTLAFDLTILLTVTSLLRVRIGRSVWRAVHWLAYLLWPLAMLHYLGTGTDMAAGWGFWLAVLSAALVGAAIVARVVAGRRAGPPAAEERPVRGAPVGLSAPVVSAEGWR